jgi:hypothetical protein
VSTISIALAIPSRENWTSDFGKSITMLCMAIQRYPFKGYTGRGLELIEWRSSILPQSRQRLVQAAIQHGHTHVLFIDTDQSFPPQLAHMLARHGKRVIGCNIATKTQGNSIPTARSKPGPGEWWGGHKVYSNGKRGVEQVWRLGFGVIMINLDVFKDLPKPWFNLRYMPEIDDFLGEDWWFCELMEERGIPIFVEHEASLGVDHIGVWRYGHDGVVPEEAQKSPLGADPVLKLIGGAQ